MNRTATVAEVARIPSCDFCNSDAVYDGKMQRRSSWAYMCEPHWVIFGIGELGLGLGQRLVLAGDKAVTS